MKLVNWNVNWATPRSKRSPEIRDRIIQHSPEIVCLTETHAGLLQGGHAICAGSDYGYGIQKSRRKVLLWSREPWEYEDKIGDDRLPPGRFISGVTRTSLGELTVVGVCVPWSGSRAGARYSAERRRAWEDHEVYLEHLAEVIARAPSDRLVVMGDFNQRIAKSPGRLSKGSAHRADLLKRAISPHVTLATSDLEYRGRRTIDHVGLSDDIAIASLVAISHIHGEQKLSDHFGVAADILLTRSRRPAKGGGRFGSPGSAISVERRQGSSTPPRPTSLTSAGSATSSTTSPPACVRSLPRATTRSSCEARTVTVTLSWCRHRRTI